jgi:predicted nucleic acid-binding protein
LWRRFACCRTANGRHAAERARVAGRGRACALADGQIAATAAVHDATIVTANVAHFEPFEGLSVENWLA